MNFEKQQGVAFVLIYYSSRNILYYMRFEELYKFWMRAQNGGRKSLRFDELDERFFMKFSVDDLCSVSGCTES